MFVQIQTCPKMMRGLSHSRPMLRLFASSPKMLRPSPMNRAAGAALIAGSGLSSVGLSSAACEPIRLVNSTRSAPPGASHVFVSGMLPITPEGKKLVGEPIEVQARAALLNMKEAVQAAGGDLDSVVKVTVYIADIELWPRFNATYSEIFGDCKPARAVVPVPTLHYDFAVEVECTAVVKGV